jgi:hypothetical protein
MTRAILAILFFLFANLAIAQSNVVAVTKSELTGVELPAGSRQDKRILSTAAAKTLLQMKAEETTLTLGDQIEVFTLMPAVSKQTEEQVKLALQKAGWEIRPVSNESAYSLILNRDRVFLMYLESLKRETALYWMPVTNMKTQTPVVNTQPVIQPEVKTEPKPEVKPIPEVKPVFEDKSTPVVESQPTQPKVAGAFTFTTINFDDGWTSTVAADYVQVVKGTTRVLLFYSSEITDPMRSSNVEFSDHFWNLLVAPNYNVKWAQRYEEGVTYFKTYFIQGEAVDPTTNKACYLALNVLVNSGVATPVLAITSDKNSYAQQFPEPKNLGDMVNYNKFAVAAPDVVGTWSSNSGSSVNLYNTYTGNYAGMNYAQSSDTFVFNGDGTYSSKHSGASSVYGTNTYYTQEYKGKLTVTNWEMSLTNRWKDATEDFYAQFEVVRGGRILHLQNKSASGIRYHLVKVN